MKLARNGGLRCTLALAVFLLAAPALADYLLDCAPNRSFERDANRDDAPDGWQSAVFDSPAKTAWDNEIAHTGQCSVRISDSKHSERNDWKANTGRWITPNRKAAQPGRTYSLRGWVKTRDATGPANIRIAWWNGSSWLAEATSESITGTNDWQLLAVSAKAPAEADSCSIYLGLGNAKGTAWFDDISMVEGTRFPHDYRTIDLIPVCNAGFADDVAGDGKGGWTDQGTNDLRAIPKGNLTFRGVPFHIIDPARNDGNSCIILRGRTSPDAPREVNIQLNQPAHVLYFLHGCAWAGPEGKLIARYTISYADGQHRTVPLRTGSEITDWWQPYDTDESAVGWEGANPESDSVGLNIFPWTNPRPDVQIASVSFSTVEGDPMPILAAITAADGPPVLTERPRRLEFTDKTDWYKWPFVLDDPTLDNIDLSFLLDPPAGKHGFLEIGDDGHFVFEDGTPIRFFGTNVGGSWCCPPKPMARTIAQRLARFGVNMVRLHAPDGKWASLIDYDRGDTRHFDPEALDRYDYFCAQLKQQGIYLYFDLYDYRYFQKGDGVEHADEFVRNWYHCPKGATSYDPTLIELQKEYATKLLTHKNPYTGNRYVDEPALAVQEITNENSVFYMANTDLTIPHYVEQLRGLWNEWLLETYGGRDQLAEAWTNDAGVCALARGEEPNESNVELPLQHLYADPRGADYNGPRSPARLNAMTRFLYDIQVDYFRQMYDHLRDIGLKCPITGTNQDFSDASNWSNAACDFMSRNNYWQHPDVRAKPFMRFGNDPMVGSDIATTANPVSNVCSSAVADRPMIVPEFNAPWPNEYRCECLPLMAAYGRLQGWDGLLYFAYDPDEDQLSSFGNQSDPVRWGQVPMAALIFLRGDVSEARNTVHIGHSKVDSFSTRPRRAGDRYSPHRTLAYVSKVRNVYFDHIYGGDADVAISSGHSAAGDYTNARHAIVFADWPYTDQAATRADRAASALNIAPDLQTRKGSDDDALVTVQWADEQVEITADTMLETDSLPAGATPIAPTTDGHALGYVDDQNVVAPNAAALTAADPAWQQRLYLAAAQQWGLPVTGSPEGAGAVFRSDTGELSLDRAAGLFTINVANCRCAIGNLADAGPVNLGGLEIDCKTPFASVHVVSLDGDPIAESPRILLTAVSRAENTGQAFSPGRKGIPERGRTPVLVEPVDCTVTIARDAHMTAFALSPTGKKLTELPMEFGDGVLTIETAEARSPWILLEQ